MCRGISNKVDIPINHRTILALVSSAFDQFRLFSPFIVHIRRLLKSIWTKNGQHWDKEVLPGETAFLEICKEQLQVVVLAHISFDGKYFNTKIDRAELHVFADASLDTMCEVH